MKGLVNMGKLYLGDELIGSLDSSDIKYDTDNSVKDKIDEINNSVNELSSSIVTKTECTLDEYVNMENEGTIDPAILYMITDGNKNLNSRTISYNNTSSGLTSSNIQSVIDELSINLDTINEQVTQLNSKMEEYIEVFETTISSDSGTVTKRCVESNTTSIVVQFSAPFVAIPTVTGAITSAVNYKGASMLGYLSLSFTDITKTSFIIKVKNSHTSTNYWADCTIEWNAIADTSS